MGDAEGCVVENGDSSHLPFFFPKNLLNTVFSLFWICPFVFPSVTPNISTHYTPLSTLFSFVNRSYISNEETGGFYLTMR